MRHRKRQRSRDRRRLLGQCHRLGKTVFGVLARFALPEDMRPRTAPNPGRGAPPLGNAPKTSRVSLSSRCQCRMSPSGPCQYLVVSLARSDRKAHHRVNPPIGSCAPRGFAAPPQIRWWSLSRQRRAHRRLGGGTSEAGGAYRDRTGDLMLAKHALSQLS
jgi:hypothetical protein